MKSQTFAIGDTVIVIDARGDSKAKLGDTGRIINIDDDGFSTMFLEIVCSNRKDYKNNLITYGMYAYRFKKVNDRYSTQHNLPVVEIKDNW